MTHLLGKKNSQILDRAITLSGEFYNPNIDVWLFTDGTRDYKFDFHFFSDYFSKDIIVETKKCFVCLMQKYAYSTVKLRYYALKKFARYVYSINNKLYKLQTHDVINYIYSENSINNKRQIKLLLLFWHGIGSHIIENETIDVLNQVSIPSHPSGQAVKTCDPIKGAYSEQEFQNLCDSIHIAYEKGTIDDRTYLLSLLFNMFGFRPRQIAWLKICDFNIVYRDKHPIEYFFNVPRDKQNHVEARMEFTKRSLDAELGGLIEIWIEEVKAGFRSRQIEKNIDLEQLPIFPQWENKIKGMLKYHTYVNKIRSCFMNKMSNRINVISHRTGNKLFILPRRSRYYIGTLMAMNGCSRNIIAHTLDHSNIQSCECYIQFGNDAADVINNGVAPYHKQLVNSFTGKIFKRSNIVGTRQTYNTVRSSTGDEEAGFCVKPSGCAVYSSVTNDPETFLARVPFSCYRCPNFNAFDDLEVHKKHIAILKRERDNHLRAFAEDGPATQPVMALHYDPLIQAIEDVIAKIIARDISTYNNPEMDLIDSW